MKPCHRFFAVPVMLLLFLTGCREIPDASSIEEDGQPTAILIETVQEETEGEADRSDDISSHVTKDILVSEAYGRVLIDADVTSSIDE